MAVGRSPQLVNELAIVEGVAYTALTDGLIAVAGDQTDAFVRGYIKDNGQSENGDLIADFEFEPSEYHPDADVTIIKPFLSAETTSGMQPTTWEIGKPLNSRDLYMYTLEITIKRTTYKLAAGFVQVQNDAIFDYLTRDDIGVLIQAFDNYILEQELVEAISGITWDSLPGKPIEFTPEAHTHANYVETSSLGTSAYVDVSYFEQLIINNACECTWTSTNW